MAQGAVRVKGLREFQRACNKSTKEARTGLRKRLEQSGRVVADEARRRLAPIDSRSAASIRPRVRRAGLVVVEQRRRKTTGLHPEFGKLQMRRALLPAREAMRPELERDLERMLDDIVDGF